MFSWCAGAFLARLKGTPRKTSKSRWLDAMEKAIGSLDLNRPQSKQETAGGARLQNTSLLKERLLEELVELDKQMEILTGRGDHVDFSMIQTYKEMIHSRKSLFIKLNR